MATIKANDTPMGEVGQAMLRMSDEELRAFMNCTLQMKEMVKQHGDAAKLAACFIVADSMDQCS